MSEIIEGDCIEVMKQFKDKEFDLCLTDPPYNVKKDYGPLVDTNKSYNDYLQFSKDWFKEARRISKGVLFTPGPQNEKMWCTEIEYPKWKIVWYKTNKFAPHKNKIGGFIKYEHVFAYDDVKVSYDVFAIPIKITPNVTNPTVKTLRFIKTLLRKTRNIQTVIDPMCGSGTTLVACKELGIDCIGIEINPIYVEEIKQRLDRTIPKTNVASWF